MGEVAKFFAAQRGIPALLMQEESPEQRFARLLTVADDSTAIVVDTAMSSGAKVLYEHLAARDVRKNYPNRDFVVEVGVGWHYWGGRRWVRYHACGVLTVTFRPGGADEPIKIVRFS